MQGLVFIFSYAAEPVDITESPGMVSRVSLQSFHKSSNQWFWSLHHPSQYIFGNC